MEGCKLIQQKISWKEVFWWITLIFIQMFSDTLHEINWKLLLPWVIGYFRMYFISLGIRKLLISMLSSSVRIHVAFKGNSIAILKFSFFLIFKNLFMYECSVCMHVYRSHYRWLWATMWLLGIELKTFWRVASALKC